MVSSISDFFFFFFERLPHLCVLLISSHPPPPHPLSTPTADPLCRPANGGSTREDEGEESADRRAGHACITSQRKSLTPWAEAGKTVILFFFSHPSTPPLKNFIHHTSLHIPSLPPSPVPAQWKPDCAKLSQASRTNICEKKRCRLTAGHWLGCSSRAFCK